MPNRELREGILHSRYVNNLTDSEEVFYRRLMSVVDDYGRFHNNPTLLRAAVFPLKVDQKNDEDIISYLAACKRENLVLLYTVDGYNYIQISKFRQRKRAMASKFPAPPWLESDGQMPDMCPTNDGQRCHENRESRSENREARIVNATAQAPGGAITILRSGKKISGILYREYVKLAEGEYERMVRDWGKRFTDEAIKQYDLKYPNSGAIQKHTDHNRGIRDYVSRGFICADMKREPYSEPKPKPTEEEIGTEEDRLKALNTMNLIASKFGVVGAIDV